MNSLVQSPILACLYFATVYSVCFVTAYVLFGFPLVASSATTQQDRFGCIDGLRGVLAIGVMCHHAYTATIYFRTGSWWWSTSPILNHLGDTTVGLFFLITSFLFTRKACRSDVDWAALYRSRFVRLAPLYLLVVAYVFVASFIISDGAVREPMQSLASELLQWASFVIYDRPNINGVEGTWRLIAGVNWTLAYEWLFYLFAIPTINFTYRLAGPRGVFIIAAVIFLICRFCATFGSSPIGDPQPLSYFALGSVIALVSLHPGFGILLRSTVLRAICASSILLLAFFRDDRGTTQIIAAAFFFLAIVSNFSLFGLLRSRPAIWLGDVSYGIYLSHGAVLYWTFRMMDADILNSFGIYGFMLMSALLAFVVICAASLSYLWIERPAMELGKKPNVAHS